MTNSKNSRPATASLNVAPDAIFLTTKELAARHRRNLKTLRTDRVKGIYSPWRDLVCRQQLRSNAGQPRATCPSSINRMGRMS
jgi:hypothetical protein